MNPARKPITSFPAKLRSIRIAPATGWCWILALSTASAAIVNRGPYLQSAGHDRITICWRTDVPTTSEVVTGADAGNMDAAVSVEGMRTDHFVTLTGLQPDTRYFYRIKGTPESGAAVDLGGSGHWFRTSPAPGTAKPARFWVVGDSGYQYQEPLLSYNSYMSATAAAGKTTSAFIMLGDNAYATGTQNEYQGAVFNRYFALLRNTPWWSAVGNHDDTSVPAVPPAPYYSIFHFPTNGECGGAPSGTENYYSFDYGNIHFIALDTNTYPSVSDAPGGTYGMVDWLLDDLKACTADWIVAFSHQPPYSKGSHDSDTEQELVLSRNHIIPLLESYGVDLVLSGHSHNYERSGLMDGHYGKSETWNPATMVKQPGNGSELGGGDLDGVFVESPAAAGGAYEKPAALGRSGAVYLVAGASSSVQSWVGGSMAFINPSPHPAHLVSINLLGSVVLEVEDGRLNARYHDMHGAVWDDFTIVKGATYTMKRAEPASAEGSPNIAFPVTRTGAVNFAEQVPVGIEVITGGGVSQAEATAEFAAGQTTAVVTFFPAIAGQESRFRAELLPTARPLQAGAAPRNAYRISGEARIGHFAATPAETWYASRFGQIPAGPEIWNSDDDGDGLTLLLEYALRGEPDSDSTAMLPRGEIEGGSFVFRYIRPHGRSDLSYQVLASEDLATWPQPGLADLSEGPPTALGEPRKVEVPIDATARFIRLEVGMKNP